MSELAVMWRFVGVVGACLSPVAGGRLAAAEAVRTSASTKRGDSLLDLHDAAFCAGV